MLSYSSGDYVVFSTLLAKKLELYIVINIWHHASRWFKEMINRHFRIWFLFFSWNVFCLLKKHFWLLLFWSIKNSLEKRTLYNRQNYSVNLVNYHLENRYWPHVKLNDSYMMGHSIRLSTLLLFGLYLTIIHSIVWLVL